MRTGKPIAYTSADSVSRSQRMKSISVLQRLYDVCQVARELTYPMNIGRVIARPFVGETAKTFTRTGHRKDYAVPPPRPRLLQGRAEAGRDVISVGKIGDIYAHSGTGREVKVAGNPALMETTLAKMRRLSRRRLPDDQLRRLRHRLTATAAIPIGYGTALEDFDRRLAARSSHKLREGDLLILTADHGNDPTWKGTDHTREQVPVMTCMRGITPAASASARASPTSARPSRGIWASGHWMLARRGRSDQSGRFSTACSTFLTPMAPRNLSFSSKIATGATSVLWIASITILSEVPGLAQ